MQDKNELLHQQRASTRLWQIAVEAAPSGILVVDSSGNIIFANNAVLDMFAYRADELLGQPVEILIPKEFAESHRQNRKAYENCPSPRKMGKDQVFEGIKKTGQRFPLEIGLQPGEYEYGKVVVATVIDITERKLIEDRLRRHEEDLEQLVAERTHELQHAQLEKERIMDQLIQAEKMTAIGALASGIGHEINNPLYALLGLAEAIEEEKDISRCHEYGRKIIRHSLKIAQIVKNLSGYAQPSARHELQDVDLNECIRSAVALARRSLLTDNVEFRLNTGQIPTIRAKPDEIQQAFFNVIRNGIQAIKGKGVVEIDSNHQDTWVTVRIKDSGPGISKEDHNKVFDPFFTTKSPDQGEGLGLFVVSQIVAKYESTISLESESGKGAAFIFRFPIVHSNQ